MLGLMMHWPLMISSLIRHADRCHGDAEIVSRTVEGPIHRYTYATRTAVRGELANALAPARRRPGDRVGTLAWNGYRHFELYYGVSGIGAIIHTINPRLFHEQLTYIVEHAGDRWSSSTHVPAARRKLAPHARRVTTWIALTDRAHMPASALRPLATRTCSPPKATTTRGRSSTRTPRRAFATRPARPAIPKACCSAIARRCCTRWQRACRTPKGYSAQSVILPIVPMFHVNAWGFPYSAPLVGAKLVFPGAGLDGKSLYELFEGERVDSSAGVPTVWLGLIQYMKQNNLQFSTLKTTTIGGAACPTAMIQTLRDEFGCARHAWLGNDGNEPRRNDRRVPKRSTRIARAEEQPRVSLKARQAACTAST